MSYDYMEEKDIAWLLTAKYGGEKTEGFFADCKRLQAGEPLAYVIGHIPFLGTTIYLDSHPLIPRTETEYWVERVIEMIKDSDKDEVRILDLCAGSGCIGIAVLHRLPHAQVDFAEIDGNHIDTIYKNIERNDIDLSRTHVIQSDLFENISGSYDYILSNPPYIDPILDRTEPSVTTYEPHIALYGGTGGMECIKSILTDAPKHLKKSGTLCIEHEPEQEPFIHEHARGTYAVATHPDQYGVHRYSILELTA